MNKTLDEGAFLREGDMCGAYSRTWRVGEEFILESFTPPATYPGVLSSAVGKTRFPR